MDRISFNRSSSVSDASLDPNTSSQSAEPRKSILSALNPFGGHDFGFISGMKSLFGSVNEAISNAISSLKSMVGETTDELIMREAITERPEEALFTKLELDVDEGIERKALSERPEDSTPKAIKKTEIEYLNQSGEVNITSSVIPTISTVSISNGLTQEYTTEITGASAINPLQHSYTADNAKVISSKDDANSDHSVNASMDKLIVKDGTLLLSDLRSGVYTTPKIKDKGDRIDAANTRFNENLLIILDDKKLLPGQTEASSSPNSEKNPIELPIADIGLLSGFIGSGGASEGQMQDEQFDFLEGANHQLRQIDYIDAEGNPQIIYVKPEILSFNFGVSKLDATFDSIGGARNEEKNRTSFESLRKYVGPKIALLDSEISKRKAINPKDPEIRKLELEKQVIQELADQLHEMVENGNVYSPIDRDRYAFTARLNLLCFKIGITPMIHCKSGKDRTARLIEETKLLAILIHEAMTKKLARHPNALSDSTTNAGAEDYFLVPKAGKLDLQRQRLLLDISMHSGNDVIQKNCTGFKGNKQADTLKERISDLLDHPDESVREQAKRDFELYKAKKGIET